MQTLTLRLGDCFEKMKELKEGSVGSICTDPPYGLSFMGKTWDKLDWRTGTGFSDPGIGDRETPWPSYGGTQFGGANPTCSTCGGRLRGVKKCACDEPDWVVDGEPVEDETGRTENIENVHAQQAWHLAWLKEAFRIIQPGGIIKAFGGTRTFHRLGMAMQEAGFVDIHLDAWTYGSGFPKSLNISKAIDRAAGATQEVVGPRVYADGTMAHTSVKYEAGMDGKWNNPGGKYNVCDEETKKVVTAPSTEAAKKFAGYGTALKPAWEPFIVGRKP